MDRLRIGVIGVGSVVREIYQHLYYRSAFSDILDVAAVADPNDECRNWFCNEYNIPNDRRFTDYREMLDAVPLDAVQVNTPDHIHAVPTIDALNAGLDVVLPKPLAATVKDAYAMIETANKAGRLIAVDFHKREDPRIKEAEARYRSGRYGALQTTVWYMIDKLMVVDPNRRPPFFATPDFAEKNTPISFLTVHMADALMTITDLRPIQVRALGYSQKLPGLSPMAVRGYDLCNTEILLEKGATAHIITGWHLPNTAHAASVQSSRMICTDGMLDLGLDTPGYHEIHPDGILEINPLFRNFESDGSVAGYGVSYPGRLYRRILSDRSDALDAGARAAMMTPAKLGFYATLVCEGAEESLKIGREIAPGVTEGATVGLSDLLRRELGDEAAASYLPM